MKLVEYSDYPQLLKYCLLFQIEMFKQAGWKIVTAATPTISDSMLMIFIMDNSDYNMIWFGAW